MFLTGLQKHPYLRFDQIKKKALSLLKTSVNKSDIFKCKQKRLFLLKSNKCFWKNRYTSISFESKNESMRKVVKRKGHISKKKGHIFPEKGHFNVNPPPPIWSMELVFGLFREE